MFNKRYLTRRRASADNTQKKKETNIRHYLFVCCVLCRFGKSTILHSITYLGQN